MATFTASELTSQVRELHAGLQSKSSRLTAAVTGTASSVFYLCKVPHGATILDFLWYAADGGANQTYKLGLQLPMDEGSGTQTFTVTESALSGDQSNTGGATLRGQGNKLPYVVSLSDSVIQRWAWVQAVASAAISASATMNFSLIYTMDGS